MTASKQRKDSTSKSGQDVFAETGSISKKLITAMLVRMIESAGDYHGWSLSDEDSARMVKLIKRKQRIICSAFAFQMNKYFAEFKSTDSSKSGKNSASDWQRIGLSGENDTAEINELQAITSRYADAFKEFDRTILKRLQTCIKRSRANVYDNPLQVKRLCESFQYAIDSLNLEVNFKIALYHLFADRFIEALGPTYRRIDQFLHDSGMQPELPIARIQLRSIDGLSESESPQSFKPDQSPCLFALLEGFKEKSSSASSNYKNLFPELKQRFNRYALDQYDAQIDQLTQMFDMIFEDEDLPSPVKQQLARLQIFIFITAVQENGSLRGSSNPARRLLDGITSSEVEITKSGNSEFSGIRFIREYIDEIASGQVITADNYTEMLEGYQSFVKENETSIRKARKLEATNKVLPAVKERLHELTQPLKIQGTRLILFEKVWLPLLVQIALREGMDSETWHKTISMVKKQVWSLIPKSSPEEQAKLLKVLPNVAHSLHRAMRSLKLAESLQKSLRDYLKLEQQKVTQETAQNIIQAKRRTRSLAAQSFDTIDDTTDFDEMMQTGIFQVPAEMLNAFNSVKPDKPKKISQVDALATGDWVSMRHEGKKVLAKVTWKAEDSSLFIFIDRDGNRICELDANALGQQFESGDVKLMDSGSEDSEKTQFSFMKSL